MLRPDTFSFLWAIMFLISIGYSDNFFHLQRRLRSSSRIFTIARVSCPVLSGNYSRKESDLFRSLDYGLLHPDCIGVRNDNILYYALLNLDNARIGLSQTATNGAHSISTASPA